MKNQTITSKGYKTNWIKYFNKSKRPFTFNSIKDVSFVKKRFFPLYENIAGKSPPGIYYSQDSTDYDELKGKVLLLYNIPDYYNVNLLEPRENKWFKNRCIEEYKGYLSNFSNYKNCDDYLKTVLGRKLQDIRRRKKRLEKCFNVSYISYNKNIDRPTYDFIFKHFKNLLKKKFRERKQYFHMISSPDWEFYYDSTYEMMLEGSACLNVIFNNEVPIAIDLNYYFEKLCIGITTAFDPDYYKFGIGSINTVKSLECSFLRGEEKFDFLKGEYGYKKKWVNQIYQSKYHIYYDSNSLICKCIAGVLYLLFKSIQYLRDMGLNNLYHKVSFYIRVAQIKPKKFTIVETDDIDLNIFSKIDFTKKEYSFLHKNIFEFLYATQNHLNSISVYESKKIAGEYFFTYKEKELQ